MPEPKRHPTKPRAKLRRITGAARSPKRLAALAFLVIFTVIEVKLLFFSHAAGSGHITATLYAYPTEASWAQVESAAPTVQAAIVDICAPDGSGSGCNGQPADAINPDWMPTINALRAKGITPLFYISTGYGSTALSTMENELKQAVTWYSTPSPMFDTMEPSGTCTNGGSPMPCTQYNGDLYTYAVNAGATSVMYNPGTSYNVTSADMFGPKVIMQVFEGTAASFEKTAFPSWMGGFPPSEFSATMSAGTSTSVGTDVSDALGDNIGNFYEDDEAEPPNYSTLPSFWQTEVKDVAAEATGPAPTPTPTAARTAAPTTSNSVTPKPGASVSPLAGQTNPSTLPSSGPNSTAALGQTATSGSSNQAVAPASTRNGAPASETPAAGSADLGVRWPTKTRVLVFLVLMVIVGLGYYLTRRRLPRP